MSRKLPRLPIPQRLSQEEGRAIGVSAAFNTPLAGNYTYFGSIDATLPLPTVLVAAPVAGLLTPTGRVR
ncbi:hypothetical protein [Croceicoccus sp. BE223]|uniref:hypothetical protein n=1 Tax=Croceicoccus sp. BE223 TaxID=2817716 RepID=UPI0028624E13|nr:hypothetical protein [Croceicoccus sp. BE223]MDR7100873.1 hypothetical protein [Croceicoccus sp. BE223]